MSQHKNQRVGVFIDVQNMYYSAKQLYHQKVNYASILKTAVNGRELVRAITYVIKADVREENDFFEALEKIGYEVRSKDLQIFFGGAKKGDWDVGIAMDIMRLAAKLDVVVLVSGDGDFKDLIEHVKALGCRGEVMAFGKTASSRLKEVCDKFIDMENNKGKFLIADGNKQTFSKIKQPPKNVQLKQEIPKEALAKGASSTNIVQKINMEQPKDAKDTKEIKPQQSGIKPVSVNAPKPPQRFDRKNDFKRDFNRGRNNRDSGNRRFGGNGSSNNRRPTHGFKERDDFRESLSLIQRLNMEQPGQITNQQKPKMQMPEKPGTKLQSKPGVQASNKPVSVAPPPVPNGAEPVKKVTSANKPSVPKEPEPALRPAGKPEKTKPAAKRKKVKSKSAKKPAAAKKKKSLLSKIVDKVTK
ncbi:MAG: NYN domain-containing protein [Nanoarchaeota archaeon]|nr:NYN domain-containing protein [Nanoarchaeota archaeon]